MKPNEFVKKINEQTNICNWCDEQFPESELTNTDLGLLCDTCIRAIKSRGEEITICAIESG